MMRCGFIELLITAVVLTFDQVLIIHAHTLYTIVLKIC